MDNPFDFFDEIYCINLPDAEERWEMVQKEFANVGIEDRVTQISAIRPHKKCTMPAMSYPLGEFGAWLSHGKALIHAIESGAENVLIMEDDVIFKPWTTKILRKSISQLPSDYDIFFLSGTPVPPLTHFSENLAKLNDHFFGAVAYCVPRRSLLKLYNLRLEMVGKRSPVADAATSQFAVRYNGYTTLPYVCLTREGMSTVRNGHRYHDRDVHRTWIKAIPEIFKSGEYR